MIELGMNAHSTWKQRVVVCFLISRGSVLVPYLSFLAALELHVLHQKYFTIHEVCLHADSM